MKTEAKILLYVITYIIGFMLILSALFFYFGISCLCVTAFLGAFLFLGQPLLMVFGTILFFYFRGRIDQIIGVIFFAIGLFDTYIVYYEIMIKGAL